MARTAKIAKEQKKPKFKVRSRNRCRRIRNRDPARPIVTRLLLMGIAYNPLLLQTLRTRPAPRRRQCRSRAR